MSISLEIVELENARSEVKVYVGDNRPITWTAKVIKGEETTIKIQGEEKTVYSMNLIEVPLLRMLASRFTDLEDYSDEQADEKALQKIFEPVEFTQLMSFVKLTETITQLMQYNSLKVDNPRYKVTEEGVVDTKKQ